MAKQDRVLHACPLITDVPGKLYDEWVVDGLHTWALGPLGGLIAYIFQFILKTKKLVAGCFPKLYTLINIPGSIPSNLIQNSPFPTV